MLMVIKIKLIYIYILVQSVPKFIFSNTRLAGNFPPEQFGNISIQNIAIIALLFQLNS